MSRILFCTWQYHPVPAGGAERQARLQAEELVARGHEVTVVCPRVAGVGSGVVGGVHVQRLRRAPPSRLRYLSTLTYFLNLWRYVILHGRRYDVVHVHLANLQADAVVGAARLVGVPTHVKVANSGTNGETRRLERAARFTRWYGLRHASSVQALSEETRQELLRIGVSETRIVKLPNGVSDVGLPERGAARRSLGLPDDRGIVLFLGRFARYKGVGDLLAAWGQVAHADWTLLLVGEAAVDEPYGPLPRLPDVVVHPWTTNPQLYYAASDVFVLPSHSEGMSNALLEAMTAGLAVVTSDTGAASEMVEHQLSGLVHPSGDVGALVDCLDRVVGDPVLRQQLAVEAKKRASDFGIRHVVDLLEDVYRRVGRETR